MDNHDRRVVAFTATLPDLLVAMLDERVADAPASLMDGACSALVAVYEGYVELFEDERFPLHEARALAFVQVARMLPHFEALVGYGVRLDAVEVRPKWAVRLAANEGIMSGLVWQGRHLATVVDVCGLPAPSFDAAMEDLIAEALADAFVGEVA